MLDKGQVWFAPMRDIAAHVRGCMANGSWSPRRESAALRATGARP
jgi:peptidoglycan-N-acetylglucosamine deacetylase